MWGRKAGDQPISQSAAEESYVGLIRCDENSQPFPLASVSQSVTKLCIVSLVPKANGSRKSKTKPTPFASHLPHQRSLHCPT